MTDLHETVGARIVRLAAAIPSLAGTKRQLADACGVEYETLRKWVNGDSAPTRGRAQHIADMLGIPVETLMHNVPASGLPDLDGRAALDRALRVMSLALAQVPQEQRAELGDLMRQWAVYGGRDLYRDAVTHLLDRAAEAAGPALGQAMRPLSQDALRVAALMDALQSTDRRTRLYAFAQNLSQDESDDESASSPATPPAAQRVSPLPPQPKPTPSRRRRVTP